MKEQQERRRKRKKLTAENKKSTNRFIQAQCIQDECNTRKTEKE